MTVQENVDGHYRRFSFYCYPLSMLTRPTRRRSSLLASITWQVFQIKLFNYAATAAIATPKQQTQTVKFL
jgi:hypothetical protein